MDSGSPSSDPPATPHDATATQADLSLEAERVLGRVRAGLFAADDAPLRIDRFVILRRLGSGGMGDVFLAFDPELDRRVALKVVRSDRDTPTRQDALVREAQAVAKLAHPHVVAVFELMKERLAEYTPEKAFGMCGVNAEMIRMLARKIASKRGSPDRRRRLFPRWRSNRFLLSAAAVGLRVRPVRPVRLR